MYRGGGGYPDLSGSTTKEKIFFKAPPCTWLWHTYRESFESKRTVY